MTTIAPTNTSFFAKCCPCNCSKITTSLDSALPWIGIAVSVIGVVAAVFSSSWPAAIGFTICGLILLHSRFCGDTREISDLKAQMEKADQELIAKQAEITSATQKLANIEQSAQKAQQEFDKKLDKYKSANHSLEKIVKDLPSEQTKLAKRNKKLEQTVTTLTQQVEESKVMARTFEKQIHRFINEHEKVVPQLDQLSEAAQSIEGSEQKLQASFTGFSRKLAKGLESFAIRLRAWQLTTDQMMLQNKTLSNQITELQSVVSKEGKIAHEIERASETFGHEAEHRTAQIQEMKQLRDDITRENRIAEKRRRGDAISSDSPVKSPRSIVLPRKFSLKRQQAPAPPP